MHRRLCLLGAVLFAGKVPIAQAHGTQAGELTIEHAYALPSAPGSIEGRDRAAAWRHARAAA